MATATMKPAGPHTMNNDETLLPPLLSATFSSPTDSDFSDFGDFGELSEPLPEPEPEPVKYVTMSAGR